MKYSVIRLFSIIILVLFLPYCSYSQLNPYTLKFELTPIGIDAIYLDDYLNDTEIDTNQYFILAKKLINEDKVDYVIFKEIPNKLFKLDRFGKLKEWEIVVNRGEYFILCPENFKGECSCKDNVYIYIPSENFTKYINSFFPIVPKKDLVKTIKKYTKDKLDYKNFKKYCDIIQYLKGLNRKR